MQLLHAEKYDCLKQDAICSFDSSLPLFFFFVQVTELNLDNCRVTQISGLTDEFKNLRNLSLINVGLTTLKGFPSLPKLEKVFHTYFWVFSPSTDFKIVFSMLLFIQLVPSNTLIDLVFSLGDIWDLRRDPNG